MVRRDFGVGRGAAVWSDLGGLLHGHLVSALPAFCRTLRSTYIIVAGWRAGGVCVHVHVNVHVRVCVLKLPVFPSTASSIVAAGKGSASGVGYWEREETWARGRMHIWLYVKMSFRCQDKDCVSQSVSKLWLAHHLRLYIS